MLSSIIMRTVFAHKIWLREPILQQDVNQTSTSYRWGSWIHNTLVIKLVQLQLQIIIDPSQYNGLLTMLHFHAMIESDLIV